MTSAASPFELDTNLDRVHLEINPNQQAAAWSQSQQLATPASRWRAYLNQLSLQTVLPWLTAEISPSAQPMLSMPLLPTIWEWVEGVGIDLRLEGRQERWVLLPTEAIDEDELRVPQEWVDIPSWAGDYYMQLQVNVDDGWVKLAGIATHQALKADGYLDRGDRTYSLSASDLITDINWVSLSHTLNPTASTQTSLATATNLPLSQAQQLITRLSNPELLNPRLAIDFANWSALMAHGGWRRQMAEQRWGRLTSFAVRQWFQSGITQLAEQIGWQSVSFQAAAVGARGEEAGDEATVPSTGLSRTVEIWQENSREQQREHYTLQILPLPGDTPNAWRFELRKLNGFVSQGVTLRLLSEDLQPFENNQVTATDPVELLYVDVALAPGEGIVWEIEPMPAQYEPEILRFDPLG